MDNILNVNDDSASNQHLKRKHSSSDDSSPNVTPPRKIVLGVVDATNIKCTNVNRKRRWDQGPEVSDTGSIFPVKKQCIDKTKVKEFSTANNFQSDYVGSTNQGVSEHHVSNDEVVNQTSEQTVNSESSTSSGSYLEIKKLEAVDQTFSSSPQSDKLQSSVSNVDPYNDFDQLDESKCEIEIKDTSKIMEIIHTNTPYSESLRVESEPDSSLNFQRKDSDVSSSHQKASEVVIKRPILLVPDYGGESSESESEVESTAKTIDSTLTEKGSVSYCVNEQFNKEPKGDPFNDKTLLVCNEKSGPEKDITNDSSNIRDNELNIDNRAEDSILSECINVSRNESSGNEQSQGGKISDSLLWDQDSSDQCNVASNNPNVDVKNLDEDSSKTSEIYASDNNDLIVEETIFIEGLKTTESQLNRDGLRNVNINAEKDVLLSKNRDDNQLLTKTESMGSDSILIDKSNMDINKELIDASGSNDGSLSEMNVNKIVEITSDPDDIDETEIIDADVDKDSVDTLERNPINMSSADNVDPAVMEIIFGIRSKPLTVSNSNEAYPTLQSPRPNVEIAEVQKTDDESRETSDDTIDCIDVNDIEHAKRVVLGDDEPFFNLESKSAPDSPEEEPIVIGKHAFSLDPTEVVTVDPNKPLMGDEANTTVSGSLYGQDSEETPRTSEKRLSENYKDQLGKNEYHKTSSSEIENDNLDGSMPSTEISNKVEDIKTLSSEVDISKKNENIVETASHVNKIDFESNSVTSPKKCDSTLDPEKKCELIKEDSVENVVKKESCEEFSKRENSVEMDDVGDGICVSSVSLSDMDDDKIKITDSPNFTEGCKTNSSSTNFNLNQTEFTKEDDKLELVSFDTSDSEVLNRCCKIPEMDTDNSNSKIDDIERHLDVYTSDKQSEKGTQDVSNDHLGPTRIESVSTRPADIESLPNKINDPPHITMTTTSDSNVSGGSALNNEDKCFKNDSEGDENIDFHFKLKSKACNDEPEESVYNEVSEKNNEHTNSDLGGSSENKKHLEDDSSNVIEKETFIECDEESRDEKCQDEGMDVVNIVKEKVVKEGEENLECVEGNVGKNSVEFNDGSENMEFDIVEESADDSRQNIGVLNSQTEESTLEILEKQSEKDICDDKSKGLTFSGTENEGTEETLNVDCEESIKANEMKTVDAIVLEVSESIDDAQMGNINEINFENIEEDDKYPTSNNEGQKSAIDVLKSIEDSDSVSIEADDVIGNNELRSEEFESKNKAKNEKRSTDANDKSKEDSNTLEYIKQVTSQEVSSEDSLEVEFGGLDSISENISESIGSASSDNNECVINKEDPGLRESQESKNIAPAETREGTSKKRDLAPELSIECEGSNSRKFSGRGGLPSEQKSETSEVNEILADEKLTRVTPHSVSHHVDISEKSPSHSRDDCLSPELNKQVEETSDRSGIGSPAEIKETKVEMSNLDDSSMPESSLLPDVVGADSSCRLGITPTLESDNAPVTQPGDKCISKPDSVQPDGVSGATPREFISAESSEDQKLSQEDETEVENVCEQATDEKVKDNMNAIGDLDKENICHSNFKLTKILDDSRTKISEFGVKSGTSPESVEKNAFGTISELSSARVEEKDAATKIESIQSGDDAGTYIKSGNENTSKSDSGSKIESKNLNKPHELDPSEDLTLEVESTEYGDEIKFESNASDNFKSQINISEEEMSGDKMSIFQPKNENQVVPKDSSILTDRTNEGLADSGFTNKENIQKDIEFVEELDVPSDSCKSKKIDNEIETKTVESELDCNADDLDLEMDCVTDDVDDNSSSTIEEKEDEIKPQQNALGDRNNYKIDNDQINKFKIIDIEMNKHFGKLDSEINREKWNNVKGNKDSSDPKYTSSIIESKDKTLSVNKQSSVNKFHGQNKIGPLVKEKCEQEFSKYDEPLIDDKNGSKIVSPLKIKLTSQSVSGADKGLTSDEKLEHEINLKLDDRKYLKELSNEHIQKDVPLLATVDSISAEGRKTSDNLKGNSSPEISGSSTLRKSLMAEGASPKLEPITLRIYKDNLTVRTEGLDSPKKIRSPKLNSASELKSQLSPHIKLHDSKSPLSPQSKQLEFTLKIAKDSATNYPKATMSPKSGSSPSGSWKPSDFTRVEKILKESNVSITPIASSPSSPDPKMNKITLKLPKDGGHPEIKPQGDVTLPRSPNSEVTITRRERTADVMSEKIGPPDKKPKLEPPSSPIKYKAAETFQKMSTNEPPKMKEVEVIKIMETKKDVSTPMNTPKMPIEGPPVVTQKKRGRPRKIIVPPPPETPNFENNGVDGSSQSFSVPLFDLTEGGSFVHGSSEFLDHSTHRPMRTCRGRTKPIVVRSRKPRGGGIIRGVGRGRGMKRQLAADLESLSAYELAELAKIEARKEKLKADRIAKKEAKQAKVLAKKLKDEERRKRIAKEKAEAQALAVLEEETRMSAPENSRMLTPGRVNLSGNVVNEFGVEIKEESQGSNTPGSAQKKGRREIQMDPECKEVKVEQLAEYQWQGSELYMIQEQISLYLGVKSFKRKYPNLKRRAVEAEERTFLEESGLVPKSMCDLGLTAVSSAEVCDIMFHDFPDKYEEFRKHVREKQAREASWKQRAALASWRKDDKFKTEPREQALESAAVWNANLNKVRKEDRRCALDLQTFTVHYPKYRHQAMTRPVPKIGTYPVTLIPGQYCDYYKEYTSAEMMYFPINTVLYGPMRPNERQNVATSEASQSDSDESSSSEDSSDSSSEGSNEENDTEDDSKCKVCSGTKKANKQGQHEVLIQCAQCNSSVHPTCQDLTVEMVPHIKKYNWQCTDCKNCIKCKDPANEDKMLFCDLCDRGYHIYCVGLHRVPDGRWHCTECSICSSCNTRDPGGPDWQHEYKKGEKGTKTYLRTLCIACSRLWRKGKYCQICLKCHSLKPEEEPGLQQCNTCDRWIHKECYSVRVGTTSKVLSNGFQCDVCQERVQSAINNSAGNRPLIKV